MSFYNNLQPSREELIKNIINEFIDFDTYQHYSASCNLKDLLLEFRDALLSDNREFELLQKLYLTIQSNSVENKKYRNYI